MTRQTPPARAAAARPSPAWKAAHPPVKTAAAAAGLRRRAADFFYDGLGALILSVMAGGLFWGAVWALALVTP